MVFATSHVAKQTRQFCAACACFSGMVWNNVWAMRPQRDLWLLDPRDPSTFSEDTWSLQPHNSVSKHRTWAYGLVLLM